MNKRAIVRKVMKQSGLPMCEAREMVKQVIDALLETLLAEHRLELRGFGVFEVKKRAGRKARNPRTGESLFVPEKSKIAFRPGHEVLLRVQQAAHSSCDNDMGRDVAKSSEAA